MSDALEVANRILHDYAQAVDRYAPKLVREVCPLCQGDKDRRGSCAACAGNGYIITEEYQT